METQEGLTGALVDEGGVEWDTSPASSGEIFPMATCTSHTTMAAAVQGNLVELVSQL